MDGVGNLPYSTIAGHNTVASCHSVPVRHTAAVVLYLIYPPMVMGYIKFAVCVSVCLFGSTFSEIANRFVLNFAQ